MGGGGGGGMSLRMAVAALGGGGGGISGAVREVASNPTAVIAQREKEKRDLQELNDRFASYIERVRFLEADNKRLQSIIDTLKVKFEQLEVTLKEMYENELAAARKTIDETTKAKAEVELRVARLEEELADYRTKYENEVREHLVTKERVPALEKGISERDAQIEFLTKTVDAQERELAKIKGDLARCQRDLRDAKTGADAEIVARIELESIVQTKDDEINFLKNMYEEKIRQLMDINFDSEDWRTMFSNELALALRDIRAEYDAILESQKGADTDSWYKAKFNEMLATSQRSGNELVESKEEVKRARAKYQELQMEISRARGDARGRVGRAEQEPRVGAGRRPGGNREVARAVGRANLGAQGADGQQIGVGRRNRHIQAPPDGRGNASPRTRRWRVADEHGRRRRRRRRRHVHAVLVLVRHGFRRRCQPASDGDEERGGQQEDLPEVVQGSRGHHRVLPRRRVHPHREQEGQRSESRRLRHPPQSRLRRRSLLQVPRRLRHPQRKHRQNLGRRQRRHQQPAPPDRLAGNPH